jgi:hypothetical protein
MLTTIYIQTSQNDLDVCIDCLKLAYDTGASEMRTKWFTLDATAGLRWVKIGFGTRVLDRVAEYYNSLETRSQLTTFPELFIDFVGVHLAS